LYVIVVVILYCIIMIWVLFISPKSIIVG
jgi:hypothetical protein